MDKQQQKVETLIKLDTVKIRVDSTKYLTKKISAFECAMDMETGEVREETYHHKYSKDNKLPIDVVVKTNHEYNYLTIEFSAKILLDDYPEMITKYTIRKCMENLKTLGVCEVDVEGILTHGRFTSVQAAEYIPMRLTAAEVEALCRSVVNPKYRVCQSEAKTGITLIKDVKSKSCMGSLTIYDKEAEMHKHKREYDQLRLRCKNPDSLNVLYGKTKVEYKYHCAQQIRSAFNVPNANISTVLNSTATPIIKEYNTILGSKEPEIISRKYTSKEIPMIEMILHHNHDLGAIRQLYKVNNQSKSVISTQMKKVSQLNREMLSSTTSYMTILGDIRRLIENAYHVPTPMKGRKTKSVTTKRKGKRMPSEQREKIRLSMLRYWRQKRAENAPPQKVPL